MYIGLATSHRNQRFADVKEGLFHGKRSFSRGHDLKYFFPPPHYFYVENTEWFYVIQKGVRNNNN